MKNHSYQHLLFETYESGILILTINRPDKLNALNSLLLDEIGKAIEAAETSDLIRGIIITGSGDKAFVAGADIKELSTLDQHTGEVASLKGQKIFDSIESCSKPVIALVNGYALGGGLELAMACHIRIAAENAIFGLPEVSLGLIPGYGGTQRLPHLVGKGKAMEMILTGDRINAAEALKAGLVNDVAPAGEALQYSIKLLNRILNNGPLALTAAIKALNAAFSSNGYKDEAREFGKLCSSDDFSEGTKAFLEKRKAAFKKK